MALFGKALQPQSAFGKQSLPCRRRSASVSHHLPKRQGEGGTSWRIQGFSGELWGAVNALTFSLCTCSRLSIGGGKKRQLRPPQAASSATSGAEQPALRDLDFMPSLSWWEKGLNVVISLALCCGMYYAIPDSMLWSGWKRVVGLAALAVATYSISSTLQTQKQFRDREQPEHMLGDSDSIFTKLLGMMVHYKRKAGPWESAPGGRPACLMHCYHGFGANTFSWALCQQELANELDGAITAHDTPGFGLTQRPLGLEAYTSGFNGQLGREVLDLQERALDGGAGPDAVLSRDPEGGHDGNERRPLRVLMGHSMGGAAVVEEVLRAPDAVDCVILVSPAVIAFSGKRGDASKDTGPQGWRQQAAIVRNLSAVVISSMVGIVLLAVQPLLLWVLRAMVRSRSFWERGLQSAWFDSKGVTPELVDAYRMPQLVRGWEMGILRFLRAKLVGATSLFGRLRSAIEPVQLLSMTDRFSAVICSHGIQVLLIHGVGDQLVPVSNSRRLAAKLGPNAKLIEVPKCGHQPQEEMPQDFVKWVSDFITKQQQ